MLIIRGVNVYPSQVEAVLVGIPDLAPHYQLVLTREGVLASLERDDTFVDEEERCAYYRSMVPWVSN